MTNKQYRTAWARIGNASGFRLSANFFKENPQFKDAKGEVEVIAPNTLLVRLQPQALEQQEDELMLSLYLDFLTKQALLNPDDELEAYTSAMAKEDEELMTGVEMDADDCWSLPCDR
jgi:antitoxin PrlF